MQSAVPILFFGAVVAIIIVGAVYSYIAQQKRREGMFALAVRLGLDFRPDPDYSLAGAYGFLNKLAQGDNRYAYNVLSGVYQGNKVLAFDYHYQVTTQDKEGSHTTHYRFSFFILSMSRLFPDLTIRRETFLTRIGEMFGYQDIKFESAEFSKTFCVRCVDKKLAYDICNPKMMEYLLANRDLSVEIENQVIALAFDSCLSFDQVEFNLNRLAQIRSLLPEYLFADTTTR